MNACLICLSAEPVCSSPPYHRSCLLRLFGAPKLPRLDLDLISLPARVENAAGKMSISGAQRKAFLRLSDDRSRLEVAETGTTFILKPRNDTYVHVPENEHVSMCLAALAGIDVPPFGLIHLSDGTAAYIVRRFDRTDESPPRKLNQVDFCQLANRPSRERGYGTAEECARLVARYAGDRETSLRRLFRVLVVSYWLGNGDLHLKNLSLLQGTDGVYRLSPAYDIVSTSLYGDRTMTLAVDGKTKDVPRKVWIELAERYFSMSIVEAVHSVDEVIDRRSEALAMLDRSALPQVLKRKYQNVIKKRSRALR